MTINIVRRDLEKKLDGERRRYPELRLAPSFPLDARIRKVTVNGRNVKFILTEVGDRQFAEVITNDPSASNEIIFTYEEGTDVSIESETLRPGATNQGLRILRSQADADALHLMLEGLGGRSYSLSVHGPRTLVESKCIPATKATVKREPQQFSVSFEGAAGTYVRREVTIPLCEEK